MAKMRRYVSKPGHAKARRRKRNWIQKAVKRPGELTRKLHGSLGKRIVAATKRPIWTKTGEINTNTLRAFTKTKAYQRLDTRTKQQIQFAIRAEGFRKDRKR
ncbi:hypothetical protein [Thermococcus henrietii]|uniref:hypothetical protein n=1 Tax=Thermococcus henrietii TaxID=2016361 RepID=UPI000C06B0E2|nr:hypothetical protein [Thermococcus henrietii]